MNNVFKKLDIDFELPLLIEEDIQEMLDYLNDGGLLPDVYIDNLKSDLNSYKIDFSEDQLKKLKDYYCRGGIFCERNH
jgi:hypothetical protein